MAPHHDPNSQDRVPGTPIAAAARINATEQQPTSSPSLPVEPVDTNVRQAEINVNEMVSNLQSALYDDDGQWGDSDDFLVHLASRDVHQTSHHPTFAMPRFLSQDEESDGIDVAFERYGDDDEVTDVDEAHALDVMETDGLGGNNNAENQEVNLIDLDESRADISGGDGGYFASQVEQFEPFDGYSANITAMV